MWGSGNAPARVRAVFTALVCAVLFAPAPAGAAAFVDLGKTSAEGIRVADGFLPAAVNAGGAVAGSVVGVSGASPAWWDGTLHPLASPRPSTTAVAIDDAGRVFGSAAGPGAKEPVWWDAAGGVHAIATTPASEANGFKRVSPAGVAIGFGGSPSGPFTASPPAFVPVSVGSGAELPGLVNDAGHYTLQTAVGHVFHGAGLPVTLSFQPAAINGADEIVGKAATGPVIRRASGAVEPLAVPASVTQPSAVGAKFINDDGLIVGADSQTWLAWQEGTAVPLENLLPAGTGITKITLVTALSSSYLLGVGTMSDGPHGFLLAVGSHPKLEVDLAATTPDGRSLGTGDLTEQESFNVRVTLKNASATEKIKDLAYAGGAPLTIDGRSVARIGVLSAPAGAPPTSLDAGESATFDYRLTAATDGVAAAIVKVTGKTDDGAAADAKGSLKLTVTQAGRLNAALAQWARVRGTDSLMLALARKLYRGWDQRGRAMQAQLRKVLSPAERKRWFGSVKKGVADNLAIARALLMGRSPAAAQAQFPKGSFAGVTADELYDEYNTAFKNEVGKGAAKYVKKWQGLAGSAKRQVQLAYAESGLGLSYILNSASQDQREEAEAMVLAFSDGVVNDTSSYAAWTRNEASNLLNDGQAAIYALANFDQGYRDLDASLDAAVAAPFERDAAARRQIAKYADDQPIKYQREMAKLDAKIFNAGMEVVADTVVGGAATKLVTSTGKVVQLGKKGAALLNMAKATDVVDEGGKLAKGVHAVKDSGNALGVGVSGEEAAALLQREEKALKNTAGATLVQSSDYGNVYKLPNIGGVPEATLDSKAAILKSVEEDYAKTFGRPIELAEILKPSTELRKPGAVAKLELTGQKTGKPAMIDAGMPPDALGEAVLWEPKVKPQEIPGFKNLPESRQAAAIKEYELAVAATKEWRSPAPGSKTERLKKLIGQAGTVPLDDHPSSGGLQRFINGEFELVKVPGKYADAYLIRVKKYELVVKDTLRGGKIVNTKTVVNSTKALAQGVDADAVGLAKVIGRDGAGKPILGPLDASERSFAMSRYVDRNVKARAAGLQTDLAEHGATLIMDDADAAHAGFLLPKFGVPFMPEDVGIPFLQRIAKFVAPKGTSPEEMVQKMLKAVRSEGGFGQHAVVLTKDTRFLGEVPLQAW